jgi:hypothetical protein
MSGEVDGGEDYLVRGSCLCGAVRFELSERPVLAGYCHCKRCQKRTGSAFGVSAWVNADAFRWTSGEQLVTGWRHPDGGGRKLFCSVCGGHLASKNPDTPGNMSVRMSAFDSDPGVSFSYHQYVAYAAPWDPIADDGVPHFQESYFQESRP